MAFTIGALLFTLFHTALWETFVASGLAGFGVGLSFAIMPSYIVAAAPAHEVGAALGFYQLARNVGLSVGSALAGLILAHSTARGTALPSLSGFTHSTLLSSIVTIFFGAVALAFLVPPAASTSPQITERMREGGEFSATALSIDTEGLDE
jgi:MFS family permease